ncbi:MAG: hypothetical protein ABW047_14995 [Nitrospiraceae bacterium]
MVIADTSVWIPFLPLSDLVIAALAVEHHRRVYTLDLHFKKIPELLLSTPDVHNRRGPSTMDG